MYTSVFAFSLIVSSVFGLSYKRQEPPCVSQCFSAAVKDAIPRYNCGSQDFACLCNSRLFIDNCAQCFAMDCNAADAATGLVYGENLCRQVGVAVTIPAYASSVVAGDTVTGVVTTIQTNVPPPPAADSPTIGNGSPTTTSPPSSTPGNSAAAKGMNQNFAIHKVALVGVGVLGFLLL